jgi:hypothetical protein
MLLALAPARPNSTCQDQNKELDCGLCGHRELAPASRLRVEPDAIGSIRTCRHDTADERGFASWVCKEDTGSCRDHDHTIATRWKNSLAGCNPVPVEIGGRPVAPNRLERMWEPGLQEFSQLGCRLELWDRLQFFERRREGVGEAPDCARPEFLILRFKVQIMHAPRKMLRRLQLAFHERAS